MYQSTQEKSQSGWRMQLALSGVAAIVILLTGCVSYTNVPVPNSAPAFESANHAASISVIARALNEVISKYPASDASGAYTINLPSGTTPESAQKIIDQLPSGAIMPYEGMSDEIPVYHIGRIWIRASDAKVDVVYPFTFVDGSTQDQSVTVWISGGVRKWKVYRMQHWSAGTVPTPPMYIPIYPEDQISENTASGIEADTGNADESGEGQSQSQSIVEPDAVDETPINEELPEPEHAEEEAATEPASMPTMNTSGVLYKEVPVDD